MAERERKNRTSPQDQLRTAIRRADTLARGLDRARLNRRPPDGGWSVAECLDHLNATARVYIPVFTDAIQDAREKELLGSDPNDRTWLGRFIVWTQGPPVRKKMKTFPELEPASDHDPETLLDEFEALHEELIVRMNEASDLDRKRIRVRSVLDDRLKLSLGDWFAFIGAHARRHLHQAEKARAAVEAEGGEAGVAQAGATETGAAEAGGSDAPGSAGPGSAGSGGAARPQ